MVKTDVKKLVAFGAVAATGLLVAGFLTKPKVEDSGSGGGGSVTGGEIFAYPVFSQGSGIAGASDYTSPYSSPAPVSIVTGGVSFPMDAYGSESIVPAESFFNTGSNSSGGSTKKDIELAISKARFPGGSAPNSGKPLYVKNKDGSFSYDKAPTTFAPKKTQSLPTIPTAKGLIGSVLGGSK